MKRILLFISFLLVGSPTYSGADAAYYTKPYDYTINTPNPSSSAFHGLQQGMLIAQQAQSAKQRKEAHQAQMEQLNREKGYREELRKLHDNPTLLNDESLMKLMILYPEFNDTTLKIKEAFDRMGSK
ncbi:hypothetical protein [Acinetobacter indicus]|uniref:DUF4168 domain-containing protein n=1 Tax=Acinetobacter indicus TaxID=756892 RepID=A0A6C0Y3I6_9GAMM|nr:hypothetical protein [Acinetobacter indicus]QIC70754.1 hypothetical protein FSC09_10170 [Acinetobacter indicus]